MDLRFVLMEAARAVEIPSHHWRLARYYFGYDNRKRLRAYVDTLRRIADVTILKKSAVENGKVFIPRMKTGEAVYLRAPKLMLYEFQASAMTCTCSGAAKES
jgi:phage gp29-like protein